MNLLLLTYIIFGVLAFFYELMQGSSWGFALFIGFAYPVTMTLGFIGWVLLGIYTLFKWSFSWLSRLYLRVRFVLKR